MHELLEGAILEDDQDQLVFLLSAGARVNCHFHSGTTPLNFAIACGRFKLARLLVEEAKADCRQPDSLRFDGCRRRPIHYAAACDSLEVVRLLLSVGVPLDEGDFGNATPLHHAAANGNMGRWREAEKAHLPTARLSAKAPASAGAGLAVGR